MALPQTACSISLVARWSWLAWLDPNLGEGTEADVLAVPMMTAIVDNQQSVIANSQFGYIVGFGKGAKQQYPTVEFEEIVQACRHDG